MTLINTEQKQEQATGAERRFVDQLIGLQQVSNEVKSAAHILTIFQSILQEISSINNTNKLIDHILFRVSGIVGIKTPTLFLWDELAQRLVCKGTNNSTRAVRFVEKAMKQKINSLYFLLEQRENIVVRSFVEQRMLYSEDFADFVRGVAPAYVGRGFQRLAGSKSAIAIPLLVQQKSIGVITMGFEDARISETDTQLYQTFANQIAVALSNAQKFEENQKQIAFVKKQSDQLKSILESTALINQSLDVKEVFDAITASLRKQFGYDISGLFIQRQNKLVLEKLAATETQKHIFGFAINTALSQVEFSLEDKKNIFVRAFCDKKVFVTNDYGEAAHPLINNAAAQLVQKAVGVKTVVAIPLIVGDHAIGVLSVSKFTDGTTESELDLLQTFAHHIASSIEHAQLSQDLRAHVKELQKLNEAQVLFLANTSHELKNPLASIKGNAEMVSLLNPVAGDKSRDALHHIIQSANRMTRAVSQLLLLSQQESGSRELHRENVDIADIFFRELEALRPLANTKRVRFETSVQSPLIGFFDGDGMAQVVSNLISNAIKYSPSNERILINAYKKQNMCHFTVRDFGPGIPADKIPLLFQRFFRVDKERDQALGGTGLGLAICKSIVETHGGTISVKSEIGKGAEFVVQIPL